MNETEGLNSENRYTNNKKICYMYFNVSLNIFSLTRSKREQEKDKLDPVTGKFGKITNCNGKKACGDPNFTAAICSKDSCGTLFCMFLRRGHLPAEGQDPVKAGSGGSGAVIEAPFVSWNHIIKQGYWCMPCCILEDNIHPKMSVCSSIPTYEEICKHHSKYGRCGIEFNP